MKFRFKTQPRPAQAKEFEEHKNSKARALLWQMRSGKSKVMIDTFGYQFCKKQVTGVIIIAPNGVHDNWVKRELPRHCPVPYHAHVYRASSFKTAWHRTGVDAVCKTSPMRLKVLAINSEGIRTDNAKKTLKAFLKAHKGKVFVIFDESHDFRTPGSSRTRVARSLAKHCQFRRILTGTAVSNTPLAAFSQFELLEPGALGFKNYGQFKARYAVYVEARTKGGRRFDKLECYQNLDELQDKISKWSSVVLREDSGVPPLNNFPRNFKMTAKQQTLYDRLTKEYMLEDAAFDGGARLTKLQQITRGWYYDEMGEPVEIIRDEDNPALQTLIREIQGSEGKSIIWCEHQHDIVIVTRALRKLNSRQVVEYHGKIKADERQAAIDSFNMYTHVTDFVGQPQAGGVGLDLSEASMIFWYSHTHNLIIREQASDRASQVGGPIIDVIDLECDNSVDGFILTSQRNKRSVSDELAGVGLKYVLEGEALI